MKRILFVDDEANLLAGLRRGLYSERTRWDMHFAAGGKAALEACELAPFDVVVTDMRMPGMDGATLLEHIRDRFPNTARLILSGFSEVALATRAVAVAYRVLGKPCEGAELKATIERVCTLQDIFCVPELRAVVGGIGALPSLSSTYTALSQAMRDPETSIATIAGIVEKDVAMAAKILQLVNSGFFGIAQRVTSLHTAVNYLGLATIKNLVMASETFKVFEPAAGIYPSFCEDLQHHAHRTAMIIAALPITPKERDVAVVSALLHDVGGLVLASKLPAQLCSILASAKERDCSRYEAEEDILGTSHAEIGAYLLGLWGLDNLVVEAIAHHHRPTRIPHSGLDTSAALYLADLLAQELERHPDDRDGRSLLPADRLNLETLDLMSSYPAFRDRAANALMLQGPPALAAAR